MYKEVVTFCKHFHFLFINKIISCTNCMKNLCVLIKLLKMYETFIIIENENAVRKTAVRLTA